MRMPSQIKTVLLAFLAAVFFIAAPSVSFADEIDASNDRVNIVLQQIGLLQNRLQQSQQELTELQKTHDSDVANLTLQKASKNLLDKSSLDISVSKSNLDSITMELSDSEQTINWLEKNIQEIEGQLNVFNIFGMKIARNELANVGELRADLNYQQGLLAVEKTRAKYLRELQAVASSALALKKDKYDRIKTILKSRNLLFMRQQQMRDELGYQQQQNKWLQQLNVLYAQLAKVDPEQAKEKYSALERDIFYSNENANFAYFQSLLARYKDQAQQIKVAVSRGGNSISLLNEMGNQVQNINKQMTRLDKVINSRIHVLERHINYLSQRKNRSDDMNNYLGRLASMKSTYTAMDDTIINANKNIADLRFVLDSAIQTELAARQGFFSFSPKMMIDMGKEALLIPTLAYQVTKSLTVNLFKGLQAASIANWSIFLLLETLMLFAFSFLHKLLVLIIERPMVWHNKIDMRWLCLQWLRRNYMDLLVIANALAVLYYFGVPLQHFMLVIYLACVWLGIKGIKTVARLCLVETTHDTTGHDMRLYMRLRWIILIGGVITAFTVFVNQLPLIYAIKSLCDWLFLLLVMIVSLLLLRSWDVIPKLILTHMESQHPYLQKSVSLICILIPLLMFGNSIIGMIGYVNLIKTVSWYEGVFLLVLIGYLFVRGLLSDGMEQVSRLMIQYVNNGWLWTEAFLKPIDKLLQITLFLSAWATLFIFFGWDKQSPIVERLTRLLHYELAHVLKTTITPLNIIELFVVVSVFYWTAKWSREFVYRLLASRTKDMGVRNSIAILCQYSVAILGLFIALRVLGIDLQTLGFVLSMFAFGVGLGLRDLFNNFACGFLILLERPLRVGDIVNISDFEGEVTAVGSRAVTIRTWDHMELVVPNTEVFNKSFTNWTAKDNIVRTVVPVQINRHDNPHEVKTIIQNVLSTHNEVLTEPVPEVFLKEMSDSQMVFEIRFFVNIRHVKSRTSVSSTILMKIWDEFGKHGIKPPYPQHEIFLRGENPLLLS